MDTQATEGGGVLREAVLVRAGEVLADGQPRSAKQIAAELVKGGLAGVDKSLINSVLTREGKERFVYDRAAYTYTLTGSGPVVPAAPAEGAARPAREPVASAGPSADRQAVLDGALCLLADGQPRMAKAIAAELVKGGLAGVDKSLINSVLAREGKDRVAYDRAAYTYTLADLSSTARAAQ